MHCLLTPREYNSQGSFSAPKLSFIQQVGFYQDENFISCNTVINNKRDNVSCDYNIHGKVEICSHENKHIKRLFLKFVSIYYDRIKVLWKIKESMTFCSKCVICQETFLIDYANVSFLQQVVYLLFARSFVSLVDKNNFLSHCNVFRSIVNLTLRSLGLQSVLRFTTL